MQQTHEFRYSLFFKAIALNMIFFSSWVLAVNVPVSTNPPGGLQPQDTPQIVLVTFDDSVTLNSYDLVQQALTNHFNPNGHSIKATFFVSMDASYDPYSIRKLYDAGHEIGIHTMSHQTWDDSTLIRWRQEIAGENRTLVSLAGIPTEDINGFRAPFLRPNDNTFKVLTERGFRYDASFQEHLSGYSTSTTNMIWPYTFDNGSMQNVAPEIQPATNYPGFFEIPLWVQYSNTTAVTTMDPPDTLNSNEVVLLWKTNFLEHYNGNRAPFGIFLHATSSHQWLSDPEHSAWRVGALREFISWALDQPDTWFITCNDLVDYMIDPVDASSAASHPSFQTPVRTPFPTQDVVRCSLAGSHIFYACGTCPPFAPNYTNAYLGLAPMDGGAVALNVISQDASTAWCSMTVSNDTSSVAYDWAVDFTLTGGDMLALYDATWTQSGDQVSAVARTYNRHIDPFEEHVIYFRVSRTGGEVIFSDNSTNLTGTGPQEIRMNIEPLSASDRWRLSWDDNAYVYSLECSTNLLDVQGWTVITNELSQAERIEPHADDGAPRFYRVKGTIY